MSPEGGSKSRGTRTARAAGGILVALASEFWGLGCPRIYNEVATRLFVSLRFVVNKNKWLMTLYTKDSTMSARIFIVALSLISSNSL